ncbi:MAG: superoxide dismutase family protein [Parvularculaceae bacterium]
MHRIAFALAASFILASCGKGAPKEPLLGALAPEGWAQASAKLDDPTGSEIGSIAFAQGPNGVLVRVDVEGLSQGWHGIHIHQVGDCSDGAEGFKKSGGHINPDNVMHGLLNPEGAHRADLPNLYAGADGRATAEFYRAGVTLHPSEEATAKGLATLIDEDGFAVIIHENADDAVTQPIGGAGGRVACAAVKG